MGEAEMSKAIYVYVCATRDGTKIGVSSNVEIRRKGLRQARIVKSWHRPNDARTVENTALRLVGAAPVLGVEWFDIPEADAVAVVECAIEMADAGIAWPTANSVREADLEAGMRAVSNAIADVMAKGQAVCDAYEADGYVFDRATMQWKLPA